jgi:hypothetical protein
MEYIRQGKAAALPEFFRSEWRMFTQNISANAGQRNMGRRGNAALPDITAPVLR